MLLVVCQLGRDVISYERVHKKVLFDDVQYLLMNCIELNIWIELDSVRLL